MCSQEKASAVLRFEETNIYLKGKEEMGGGGGVDGMN